MQQVTQKLSIQNQIISKRAFIALEVAVGQKRISACLLGDNEDVGLKTSADPIQWHEFS